MNSKNARVPCGRWLFVAAVLLTAPVSAADVAGEAIMVKGSVSAQQDGAEARLIEKGAEILVGDTVTTAAKSFTVIGFTDGGKVTVRPGSVLVIDEYAYGGDNDGSALKLVKGGLRALTGAIAKTNPDAYRVNTPVATMGVRGTEFDIRLCEQDCGEEEHSLTVDVIQK